MRFKWKIVSVIGVSLIMISLLVYNFVITPLIIIPSVYGEKFVSFTPELHYVAGPGNPGMDVIYTNGSIVSLVWIGLDVNVTNSYFVPVEVRYNGFEFVWLIYNQTVTDPTDVVANKDYLVWGAFRAAYSIDGFYAFGFYGRPDWQNITGYETGYDYYVSHKDLANYRETISVGTHRYYSVFEFSSTEPTTAWSGQSYKSLNPVPPGTYHIYVITYGKVSKSINLTVISVLWGQ